MARDEEEMDEKKAAPMGTRKILLIVGGAVLLNAAIVTGGLLYFRSDHHRAAAGETGSDGKGEAEQKKAAPVIYSLEPFIINIRDGQDMRYLKIKIEFETSFGAEPKAAIDPYLAPLRDAILVLLTTKTLQDVQDLQGKNRLRDEILATTNKILPPGKVSRVFFTDFVVQ